MNSWQWDSHRGQPGTQGTRSEDRRNGQMRDLTAARLGMFVL
jgi:hypothetical protein